MYMEINQEPEEYHLKSEFETSSGKVIILEMKVELVSVDKEYPREFPEAVDGKKSSVEPNIIRSNSLKALDEDLKRMDLFTVLVKKNPNTLTELTKLLGKEYDKVLNDAQILENMGIIELKKEGEEIKPVALYERVMFDFSVQQEKEEELIDMIQMETTIN
ncbi:236_t:CDS:2 [Gigaspora margarita]|uniref:236_t:CDS:1 n=1 Tax=Gigaspora margarita TaxID=4874 RepID=A0ABN7WAK9_GIGMA|nr:236_t:CDS:2 [Gigaspora margarita]